MNRAAIISTKTLKSEEATNSFDYYLDITSNIRSQDNDRRLHFMSDVEIIVKAICSFFRFKCSFAEEWK